MKIYNIIEQRLEIIIIALLGGLVRLLFGGVSKKNLLSEILGVLGGAIMAAIITQDLHNYLLGIKFSISEHSLAFLIGLLAKELCAGVISLLIELRKNPYKFINLFKKK